jgi:hypothetical protein
MCRESVPLTCQTPSNHINRNGNDERPSNEGIQAILATKILEALFEKEEDLEKRPNQACYGKIDSELNSLTDMLIS